MDEYKYLKISKNYSGEVAILTFANGKGNILSAPVLKELVKAIYQLESGSMGDERALKLLVIRGEGSHFSFGASVEEHRKEQARGMLDLFHGFLLQLLRFPVATLADIQGMCLGGAFELALACTHIAMETRAMAGQPEIKLGVFPPAACVLLPLKIPHNLAGQWILSGETIPAAEVGKAGLLAYSYEMAQRDQRLEEFFKRQFAPKSAESLRWTHKALNQRIAALFQRDIENLEKIYLDGLMQSHDANEGIQSFLEKREAKWDNR